MSGTRHTLHIRTKRSLLDNAARIIGLRLDELLAFQPYVGREDAVTQLHEMRIAAKKLRYTLEIFENAINGCSADRKLYGQMIEEIKTLQAQLGDIHDADVLVPGLIQQVLSSLASGETNGRSACLEPGVHHTDIDACIGLLAVCRETRSERDHRYAEFAATWRRLEDTEEFVRWRELLEHVAIAGGRRRRSRLSISSNGITEETGDERHKKIGDEAAGGAPDGRTTRRGKLGRNGSGGRTAGSRGAGSDIRQGHTGTGADQGESIDQGGTQ